MRVRCGKAGCPCSRGALHGPYVVRRWRERGRNRSQYVRAEHIGATVAAVREWKLQHPPVWRMRRLLAQLRQLGDRIDDPGALEGILW